VRVLFLSTWFPYPPDNGSKIRVYHLLRALGRQHRVTLISFAFGTARPEEEEDLGRCCASVQAIARNPFERNRMTSALRFFSMVPIVTRPLPEMTQAVHKALARDSFDVIIASTGITAPYALAACREPIKVLEEHISWTRCMWERYQEQDAFVRRVSHWLSWQKTRHYESRLFRRFDLCTMVSEQDRTASLQMAPGYRGRVETVPNGVDCQYNQPGLALPQPNTLIFNGALTYEANYDAIQYFLAEVYPLIRQKVPEVSLTITGSTSGVRLSGLRLDESVHLCGYIDDIRPLVAGSAACVVPIRQGGGTRLKILEAMALGTPVVATSKGVEGLEVISGEHLLLADEAASFADRTVRLLRDPALRQYLATNARRLVEQRYDWGPIGERFVALIEEVVNELLPSPTSPLRGTRRGR
jgi:sugar transferase (PEP-CTERM/EpsH1 system associated)